MKLALVFLLLSFNAFALPTAKVLKLKGEALYNGKKITKATVIEENGTIEVKPKSFLILKVNEYNSKIVLGFQAKMKIKFNKKKPKRLSYTLMSGAARWVSEPGKKAKGGLKTRNAVFGVRGTDYFISYDPLLGESEIVCFDGKVLFANRKSKKDRSMISKGQWGGLGGRFGTKIGKVLDLPKNVIQHFDGFLNHK